MLRYAMRWQGIWVGIAITVVAASWGCGGEKKQSKPSPKVIEQSGQIAKDEADLIQRRDVLLNSRRALRDERAELSRKLAAARASGGDTEELDRAAEALAEREKGLDKEESELNGKLDQILAQRRAITQALAGAGADDATQMAAREAGLAEREKALAAREERVAKREAELGEREREVARFREEKCGTAPPTTIIQTVDAKGSKYTKKDVEPLLRKARKQMSKKGILIYDLSGPTQGLEKEATQAMAEGDYGRARFAAAQLVAAIGATRINKGFISNKIDWLSARMKGKQLEAGKQKEVDKLFRDAVTAYGDDKFTTANRALNAIYSRIQ